jgi:glutathione S-transferase
MMTLCGFSASNYYNKVKLALLEKGVAFEEREVWTDQVDKATSPLGKVPYLLTPMGALSESTVILDYLEQQFTEVPLVPADPFGAAKVRELATYIDLHLELVVRNLYPEAFFGRTVSDATKETVSKTIKKNVAAFASLAKFEPFIAGAVFTLADCSAAVHLPLVSSATKIIYGEDVLADLPVRDYLKGLSMRPAFSKVSADRKANTETMMARMRGL